MKSITPTIDEKYNPQSRNSDMSSATRRDIEAVLNDEKLKKIINAIGDSQASCEEIATETELPHYVVYRQVQNLTEMNILKKSEKPALHNTSVCRYELDIRSNQLKHA